MEGLNSNTSFLFSLVSTLKLSKNGEWLGKKQLNAFSSPC